MTRLAVHPWSLLVCVLILAGSSAVFSQAPDPLVVGSKKFTENVILGEIAKSAFAASDMEARHRAELGGTRILWNALLRGDIDVYPEYTGTLIQELLVDELGTLDPRSPEEQRTAIETILSELGIAMTAPLGFDNTYAVGVTSTTAKQLELTTISDLDAYPALRFGLTNEFLDREDGWPGLAAAYGLPQTNVRGLDHDLAYRALVAGDIDAMDVYTTDAEIAYYDLVTLTDDRAYFPSYRAIFLYRLDLPSEAVTALDGLTGTLNEADMRALNAAVKIDGELDRAVAASFVARLTGQEIETETETWVDRLWRHTVEHVRLVLIALALGLPLAIPLGVLAAKVPRLAPLILGGVGIIQTIPALALLVFMIPPLGIGEAPAIAALALYCLLPVVRNTHSAFESIPPALRDSAQSLAIGPWHRLWWIELPLATRSILAGIKTSAVITIGFATLGALIGAGGYGQPILTGIRLDDIGLILEGAIPAAIMAVGAQSLFDVVETRLLPRGLSS
ncbi:MAG: glycine betaine ABC transporter substrate-binding protein [Acidobacteriota bacterium]